MLKTILCICCIMALQISISFASTPEENQDLLRACKAESEEINSRESRIESAEERLRSDEAALEQQKTWLNINRSIYEAGDDNFKRSNYYKITEEYAQINRSIREFKENVRNHQQRIDDLNQDISSFNERCNSRSFSESDIRAVCGDDRGEFCTSFE